MQNYAELCRIMQNYTELYRIMQLHKIMHLHNSHLVELAQITHLPRAEKRRVDAVGGCKDDAVVGSTTRGLILRSGRDAAVECNVAPGRYVTTYYIEKKTTV